MPEITNAKQEFIEHIEDRQVKCAIIVARINYGPINTYTLRCNHTPAEYDAFLQSLDFDYDAGYGGQELHGIIWYMDGTWSERGHYDGSEWWEHREAPEVPKELQ